MKTINKKILAIGTIAATLSPVAVLSCGSSERTFIKENEVSPLEHNYDFMATDNFFTPGGIMEAHYRGFSDVRGPQLHYTGDEYFKEIMFERDNFNIAPIKTVKSKQAITFHERISKIGVKNEERAADVYGALFNYGVKSDILTPNDGIPYFGDMKKFNHASEYNYLSNITPHTMSEGGHINLDLIVKDGVIYNIPANNIETGDTKITNNMYRAGIGMDKNGVPHVLDEIPVDDNFISLKIESNNKNIEAVEKKNIPAFDLKLKDPNGKYLFGETIAEPTTISTMVDGETRVISEFYESQKETLDLTGYKAFEVEATELNGITTSENAFGIPQIIQAPYKGRLVREVSDNASYKIPFGKSLIVHKPKVGVEFNLKTNDNVDVKYEFVDSPKAQLIKGLKWAVSTIDYNGGRFGSSALEKRTNGKTFSDDPNNLSKGNIISSSAIVYQDNKTYGFIDINVIPQVQVPKAYFVIDSVNKRFGFVHFKQTPYAKIVHQANYITYFRSLGFTDVISLDGGGSSYAYKKINGIDKVFPSTIDAGDYRPLSTAIGIGDIYE